VSDPFTEIPVVMLLFQICLPCSIELRKTVEALLHQWVTAVCSVLGLSGFLCSGPEDIGAKEKVKVERRQDSHCCSRSKQQYFHLTKFWWCGKLCR
ncbi:hypothetical protein MKW94_026710, partial [Papaver nudicaule]|nr:hypothetical protein [Papaver nudicaule]